MKEIFIDPTTGIKTIINSKTGSQFLDLFRKSIKKGSDNEIICCTWLLSRYNVKAIHPDDGWVNREKNWVILCYPSYINNISIGSHIALGSSTSNNDPIGQYRIVKVTGIEIPKISMGLITRYFFEETIQKFNIRR